MQFDDITDQRLSHVLALLRNPNIPLNETLTEKTEWQLAYELAFVVGVCDLVKFAGEAG